MDPKSNLLAQKKKFYDNQKEFTERTLAEYYISPGTRAKFDIIKENLGNLHILNAIDLGCSGNSILHFLTYPKRKFFLDLAQKPLLNYVPFQNYFPVMGSLGNTPFTDGYFDFVSALDVIEHIKDDNSAASEISRILKPNGYLVISVPHRQKYYTYQDQLIGHYRRYDIADLDQLFLPLGFQRVKAFGVYGQFMRVQMFQASNPNETEDAINSIRHKYFHNPLFKKFWNILVKYVSKVMKLDAKYQSLKNILNICVIYRKMH
jgi:SAM-dependent methyltransferase